MQPQPTEFTIEVKKEQHVVNGSFIPSLPNSIITDPPKLNDYTTPPNNDRKTKEPNNSKGSSLNGNVKNNNYVEISSLDKGDEDAQKQLVLYDPASNGAGEIEAVPDPISYKPPTYLPRRPFQSSRTLPSVGAFTVQCAQCFQWRFIPTKEKYEEIREHITEHPFVCENAREWRPEISCEDPPDIEPDGSRVWAIDKPNIAQPPPGWQRLLRIRGEGGSRFADVYYVTPSGKKLRSMVEIQKYLIEHPECIQQGVNLSQFSFQIPKPLQEDYVRKRPRLPTYPDGSNLGMPGYLEPSNATPIAWAGPMENTDLQLGLPGLSAPYFEAPIFDPVRSPKKARTTHTKRRHHTFNALYNQHQM